MAVVIETTLGDITVDLFLEQRPVTCLNFLKLCKMKYYNFNLFHSIRSGFIAQTGDPTGEGSGGESIFGLLEGPEKRFFSGEKMPKIRHTDTGMLSMVGTGDMMVGSQFFFTLGSDLDSLDGNHCVIGEVTEGQEVLRKLNEVICDETHRPYQDVRITHTVVLEDPYSDPSGFRAPSRSPSPSAERLKGGRIAPDEELDDTQGKSAQEIQEMIEEKEAKARATILEMVGDLPDADIAPPENVLFVCKLNPVTTDEDLEIIFSRFGKIVTCEVIRDKKTGDSLQYAFIEFTDKKCCEDAYFKMDNVLIDDRRIHVDFSQSVSKIKWLGKGRGVKHLTDEEVKKENNFVNRNNSRRPRSNERDRPDQIDRFHEHDRNRHRTGSRRHKEENQERSRNRDERDTYRKHKEDYMDKEDKNGYEKECDRKREVKERHQDDRESHRETSRVKNRDGKGQERNDRETTRKSDKRIDRNQDKNKRSSEEKRDDTRNRDDADRRRKNKERHNSERKNDSDENFKEKKRDKNHREKIRNENDTEQYDRRHTREPDAVYESKHKHGKEKTREDRVKERKQREENIKPNSKDEIKNKANYDAESCEENGVKKKHTKNHSIEKKIDGRKSNHSNSAESYSKDTQVENITSASTKSSKKLEEKDKPKNRQVDSKREKDSNLKRSRVDDEEEHDSKRKRREQKEDTTVVRQSKTKHDNKDEAKDLSIDKPKKLDKNKKWKKKNEKLQKKSKPKKKRKVSTSSSDSESSSSSSSSSESSSSSDSDRKKKKARRRKRRASSSTSSSSSDSSTSSSSGSSSESSSSSSDSDVKSKKSKSSKKKMLSKKGKKK